MEARARLDHEPHYYSHAREHHSYVQPHEYRSQRYYDHEQPYHQGGYHGSYYSLETEENFDWGAFRGTAESEETETQPT